MADWLIGCAIHFAAQVVVFAFDCLYLNGESLLHKPLTERRAALYSALTEKQGQLMYATSKTSRDVDELQAGRRGEGRPEGRPAGVTCVARTGERERCLWPLLAARGNEQARLASGECADVQP